MLEAVAHILPPYQHILETCERNTFSLETRTEDPRLAALLSYVYIDLVQLFLDLYRISCRGSRGKFVKVFMCHRVRPTAQVVRNGNIRSAVGFSCLLSRVAFIAYQATGNQWLSSPFNQRHGILPLRESQQER